MYKVILHRNAAKFYSKADKGLRERLNSAIEDISENPRYNIHIKKLQGELSHMYRYRLGDLRIIYEIHEDIEMVRIKTVETRGRAYN